MFEFRFSGEDEIHESDDLHSGSGIENFFNNVSGPQFEIQTRHLIDFDVPLRCGAGMVLKYLNEIR